MEPDGKQDLGAPEEAPGEVWGQKYPFMGLWAQPGPCRDLGSMEQGMSQSFGAPNQDLRELQGSETQSRELRGSKTAIQGNFGVRNTDFRNFRSEKQPPEELLGLQI